MKKKEAAKTFYRNREFFAQKEFYSILQNDPLNYIKVSSQLFHCLKKLNQAEGFIILQLDCPT